MLRTTRWTRALCALALVLALGGCDGSSPPGDQGCEATPPCGGHGTCDATGSAGACACDPGYAGAVCGDCAPLFLPLGDGSCRASVPCEGEETCGPHATCDDTSGLADCLCAPGYIGDYCDECDDGYADAGGGECLPVTP